MKIVSNADFALLLDCTRQFIDTPCDISDLKGVNQRRRGRLLLKKLLKKLSR